MRDLNKILGFDLNNDQESVINNVCSFVAPENNEDVFILKGSAGTGKTSIVKALTHHMYSNNILVRILAPTARAAKVIYDKTNISTQTIHSAIYFPETLENGAVRMIRKENKLKEYTVFIVDESSMVSNQLHFNPDFQTSRPLLDELIDYVKEGNKKNKIIFVGDRFQLPPVNELFSPALSSEYLNSTFGLKCREEELFNVMRQEEDSSVLLLATNVRDNMLNNYEGYLDLDISRCDYSSLALNWYLDCFDIDKLDAVTMICGANKNVDTWNRIIRENLGMSDYYLNVGDSIVTQENWMNKNGDIQFKGSFGTIVSISNQIRKYADLKFVDAEVRFISNEKEKIIDTKILLDAVHTNYGKLQRSEEEKLFAEVMKHNPDFRETRNRFDDEYLGALRVRHAYAITCHKAQGGEWDNVLIHPWKIGTDLPWTYTAITRARNEVATYLPYN
jgi:exodeoxyribonuclease V